VDHQAPVSGERPVPASGAHRAGRLLAPAVVTGILALTLWPIANTPGFEDDSLSVRLGLADAVRNVLLFVPLGIALARRGHGLLTVMLLATALSGCIELAQVQIPGRYGNLFDIASNLVGAGLGVLLLRSAPGWLVPTPRAAARLSVAWAAAVVAALLATGLLLQPALPSLDYYAGWTPRLGHLEAYRGRVESARLGELALPSGRLPDSAEARRLWLGGAPLRLRVLPGARVASLAPLFTLHDAARREVLLVGAERGDLVLRVRTQAQAVSLDRPGMRWPGALETLRPGEPVTLEARREGNGWCLTLGARSACPLGFTAGSGWRLVWFPHGLPAEWAPSLNAAWLALLFLPLGLWFRWRPGPLLALPLAVVGLVWLAPGAGLLATPWAELAAAGAGFVLGALLRALLAGRTTRAGYDPSWICSAK